MIGNAIGWFLAFLSRSIHALVGAGPCCRYYPSCSQYGKTAVDRFGLWCGGALLARRLLRCHPWGGSGFDPVPSTEPVVLAGKGKQHL